MDSKFVELVFLPVPEIGHFLSMVDLAKRLVNRHHRLSVTILTYSTFFATVQLPSSAASLPGIRFLNLPHVDPPPLQGVSGEACQSLFQQHLKPHVKHAITTRHGGDTESDPKYSSRLAGLVLDFFSTAVIDVADELGVPAYVYFPSGAAFLGFLLNLPALDSQLGGLATELTIPSFFEPVPTSELPSVFLEKDQDGYHWMLYHARRFRETKGIIVNSFTGLEPGLADLVSKVDCPPVYPVGPLLDQIEADRSGEDRIMKWLDDQPVGSVVFLCFGSRGAFGVGQVHEIAHGLEHSGYRFLWSLRQPPRVQHLPPSDHTNFDGVLPEGFLDRTAEKGLVCGWAPQFKILYHPSIGGFVSHGGWNSIMESLWCGVPILVWPIYAEQKLNRYRIVRDLGLGVEVTENDEDMNGRDLLMAYTDGGHLVKREKVKVAVKALMDGESEVRRKVKQMSETCREAVRDGGSSFASLGQFITDLFASMKK